MNPASFALAVASSSTVRDSQSCGKKGFAIVKISSIRNSPKTHCFRELEHKNNCKKVQKFKVCQV
ncbi:Uncharacterized protein APZ42_004173 [Daphnia magna]|uniref:Uncharacterized protein n=1 Tax=Daphnia magna TaxID=35525 RepID=A0A162C167_9CRUS|nr:Uncharacterized protein APZ42_004173 [Daphnia magna]